MQYPAWPTGHHSEPGQRGQVGRATRRSILAVLAGLLLVVGSFPAAAVGAPASPKTGHVDREVQAAASKDAGALIPVLVYRENKTAAERAVTSRGGTVRRTLEAGNALAAEVRAGDVDRLAGEPGVTRVALDPAVQTMGTPDVSAILQGAALQTVYPQAVGATELWKARPSVQGKGVTVAVVDTGIGENQDFHGVNPAGTGPGASRLLTRFAVHPAAVKNDPGHGTFVAGIIGGRGWGGKDTQDDGQYMGIAPDVNLVSVNVADRQGVARTSDVIAGIEWTISNRNRYHIRVLNLSLLSTVAESYTTSLLDAAVEMAWLKGIVVVAAAGNGGANTSLYAPANDPYVITVGATDDKGTPGVPDDERVWFSSYGRTQDSFAKPDLVAPGRRIVSTLSAPNSSLARQFPDRVIDGRYIRLSGTSASAAVVAGVVAQLLQAHPDLRPDQVKWLLRQTARALPGDGVGAGYPQAAAAARYSGSVDRANGGLRPSHLVAMLGYQQLVGRTNVSWDNVSWDNVSWDNVSWDNVSWDNVSWDNVSWDNVSWDNVSWDVVLGD